MDDIKAIDVMNYPFDPELVKIWWESSPEMRLMKDTMFKGKIPFIMCSTDEFIADMDVALKVLGLTFGDQWEKTAE